MLRDRGIDDLPLGPHVRHRNDLSLPSPTRDAAHEYGAHEQAVYAMLSSVYPNLADQQEIYQEAWLDLLEMEARGERIAHTRGLLKTLAHRRARDRVRRRRPEVIDPQDPGLLDQPDTGPLPDECAQVHLDAGVLRLVMESIDERQAAALKLRFDFGMSTPEIQEQLGVSRKRLNKLFERAYQAIREQVMPDDGGDTKLEQQQRSLLLACETGFATAAQRARAQDMVDRDPRCRAMLHTMRATLRDVAVMLPVPPAAFELSERRGPIGAILDRADQAIGALSRAGHEPLTARLSTSTVPEQAGAGLLGSLGAGAVAKAVALCIALGGTAAVCVTTFTAPEAPKHAPRSAHHLRKPRLRVTVPVVQHVAAQPTRQSRQLASTATTRRTARHERAVSSPASTPPPSPAPPGATEFGPGNVGSSSAAPTPAAAPTNGGGEFLP